MLEPVRGGAVAKGSVMANTPREDASTTERVDALKAEVMHLRQSAGGAPSQARLRMIEEKIKCLSGHLQQKKPGATK